MLFLTESNKLMHNKVNFVNYKFGYYIWVFSYSHVKFSSETYSFKIFRQTKALHKAVFILKVISIVNNYNNSVLTLHFNVRICIIKCGKLNFIAWYYEKKLYIN